MRTSTRLAWGLIATLATIALWAQPAAANTTVRSVFQVDDTAVDQGTCDFHLHFHFFGAVTISDYYDNSGFLYKEIQKGRPGPFLARARRRTAISTRSALRSARPQDPERRDGSGGRTLTTPLSGEDF